MDILYASRETRTLEPVRCNVAPDEAKVFFDTVMEDAEREGIPAQRFLNAVQLGERVFYLGRAENTLFERMRLLDGRKWPMLKGRA